jgi:hypothetical protein
VKAFGAALVAIAILYVFDSQYNDGRYTQVLQQAVTKLACCPAGRRRHAGPKPLVLPVSQLSTAGRNRSSSPRCAPASC